MFRPEPWDVVIVTVVAILLFGANRLPEVMRSFGKMIREFRSAFDGVNTTAAPKEKPALPKESDKSG